VKEVFFMATFIMFGNYSLDSVKHISAKRTEESIELIKKNGGELKEGYSLLGETDIILIVEFPDNKQAMKTSVELSKMLGISFTTAPAVTMDEFDNLFQDA
jgi:uncharacterized protein with GYD domain